MVKLDLKRTMRRLYFPPADQPILVDVPEMSFLMVDGRGDPEGSSEYAGALEALFSVSYMLKFTIKRLDPADDYTVMPLETLWWVEGCSPFSLDDRRAWKWTAMVAQPPAVTEERVRGAISEAKEKHPVTASCRLRFGSFREGLCVQMLHVGPYCEEAPTIEKLHGFIEEHDYPLRGKHHEIYLSDPRRTSPERLKTVVRQPVGM